MSAASVLPPPPSVLVARPQAWWAGVIVVAAASAAYWNSLHVPFLFDDQAAIVNNPTIRQLWPPWTALSPPANGEGVSGRPLVNLSFALNYAAGGLRVEGYHLVNLAIHALAGLTLFGVLRRTVRDGVILPGTRLRETDATWLALLIAVLWAVHPLNTESVTCVVQRNESLVGLFYLFTLYAFLRAGNAAGFGRWHALTLAACFLGMATKEVMATAPVVIFAFDAFFIARSWREAWRVRRNFHLTLAAGWLLLAALMLRAPQRGGTVGFGLGVSSWDYALTQCRAIIRYLTLAGWPHPLVLDYGRELAGSLAAVWPQALLLLVLLAVTLLGLTRKRPAAFAGIWIFAILAPSSSVVPLATQTIAEHRMYLPLAGALALLGSVAFAMAGRRAIVALAGAAVALTCVAHQRNTEYRSALALWHDTVVKAPTNARAHHNYAMELATTGRLDAAAAEYRAALALREDFAEAHNNLGSVLVALGHPSDALPHYERALQLRPDYADADRNLGVALARLDRIHDAIDAFERALQANPDFAAAHHGLGAALARLGRLPDAVTHLEAALRLRPNFPEALVDLGSIHFTQDRLAEAITCYERALRFAPDNAEAHNNLAIALESAGRTPDAIAHYEQALRLNPRNPDCEYNLALALRALGRNAEARAHYDSARRLKPGLPSQTFPEP